ncbi:MAG TPA: prolyl aminopeptidase [Gammaproteobacteria bacterium]|nr:prolyl aminopeptidase [Gammaproteobacteria bacterium]
MLTIFPPITPYATWHLPVTPPHELYIEECGNPVGLPVLFLHGGPGLGFTEDSRSWFDPERYRIILFDQRGVGRSSPHAELLHNNTQALVEDIEAIRKKLGIKRWVIFGADWGATLGLVYAQTWPQHVMAMIVGAPLLGDKEDREWLYSAGGVGRIFPDYWEDFMAPIPKAQHHHAIYEYHELLTSENEIEATRAAEAWAEWGARCARLVFDSAYVAKQTTPYKAVALARLECHYVINNYFLEPGQILRNMLKIQDIPALLIHGRYDMISPLKNSWDLHKSWPRSELYIVPESGHSASEPGMTHAYILATEKLAALLG